MHLTIVFALVIGVTGCVMARWIARGALHHLLVVRIGDDFIGRRWTGDVLRRLEREITGEDADGYWVRLIRRFRGLLGGVAAGGL